MTESLIGARTPSRALLVLYAFLLSLVAWCVWNVIGPIYYQQMVWTSVTCHATGRVLSLQPEVACTWNKTVATDNGKTFSNVFSTQGRWYYFPDWPRGTECHCHGAILYDPAGTLGWVMGFPGRPSHLADCQFIKR